MTTEFQHPPGKNQTDGRVIVASVSTGVGLFGVIAALVGVPQSTMGVGVGLMWFAVSFYYLGVFAGWDQ